MIINHLNDLVYRTDQAVIIPIMTGCRAASRPNIPSLCGYSVPGYNQSSSGERQSQVSLQWPGPVSCRMCDSKLVTSAWLVAVETTALMFNVDGYLDCITQSPISWQTVPVPVILIIAQYLYRNK